MTDWQRLDPRMLLLGPVKVLRELALPAIIAIIGIGTTNPRNLWWVIPGAIIPIVLGVVPWLTTHYRVTETQFERRSGLLNRTKLTAPLERVRSVDLESSLLHRLLGLSKVKIGTGVDETRIDLDSLARADAERLRGFLLARVQSARAGRPAGAASETTSPDDAVPAETPYGVSDGRSEPESELATIDWSWLRYAPFQLSRLAIAAGLLGALSQVYDNLPFLAVDRADEVWAWLLGFAIPVLVAAAALILLIAWLVVAVVGYVLQWWGMRLTRHQGTLRLTAGLLTTRSRTLEEKRVRGVALVEPALMRLVGGAELTALATGLGQSDTAHLLPPCPRRLAVEVGHTILDGDRPPHDGPLTVPLRAHGPVARRRCHVREQWPTVIITGLAVLPIALLDLPWWPVWVATPTLAVIGVLAGEAAYRSLGHAHTRDHLVSRSGMWSRHTTALEIDGIIGWVLRQSIFQRRVGLATLLATTAAGSEVVAVRDVPLDVGIALAARTTPELVEPFLVTAGP